MDKWPEGWSRGERERPPQPRTSVLPPAEPGESYADPYADPYAEPYPEPYPDRPYDDRGIRPPRRSRVWRRRRWGRRLLVVVLILIAALLAGYFYLDSRLHRV